MGRLAFGEICIPQDHDYDAFFQFTIVLSLFQPPHYQFAQIVQKPIHQIFGRSNLHLNLDLLSALGFYQNIHDNLFFLFQLGHGKRILIDQIHDRVLFSFQNPVQQADQRSLASRRISPEHCLENHVAGQRLSMYLFLHTVTPFKWIIFTVILLHLKEGVCQCSI